MISGCAHFPSSVMMSLAFGGIKFHRRIPYKYAFVIHSSVNGHVDWFHFLATVGGSSASVGSLVSFPGYGERGSASQELRGDKDTH